MLVILLTISLLCQAPNDVDFGFFNRKKSPEPIKQSHHSSFPAQFLPPVIRDSLPKIKKEEKPLPPVKSKIFYSTDKFGKRWQHSDQKVLDDYIREINKIPFISTDKRGYRWSMDNKEELDKFIKRQNDYYDYLDNQPKTSYVPTGTVYYNMDYCTTGTS